MNKYYEKVTPVLLGGDLNAYTMAASFAEAEGLISVCFARDSLAVCNLSSFIELHVVSNLDDVNVAVPELVRFAEERRGEKLFLIPCADWYVEMLEYARDKLEDYYFFNIPSFEVWRTTSDKASFISILDKYGIDHPKTEIFDFELEDLEYRGGKLKPPFVLKPADSTEYWRNHFDGMEKVYFPDSLGEVREVAKRIFSSGYSGKLLLQEYVKGACGRKCADASVLTVFMSRKGKAIKAVLGDVLLEELGKTSRGNYSVIVTRELDAISGKLIEMLEGIGYTGIANFDILREVDKSYCLELNPRQGRSFDYMRASGVNLAKLLLSELRGESELPDFKYPAGVWRTVSRKTMIKYSTDRGLLNRALLLEKRGRLRTPYDFLEEKKISRKIYVLTHLLREGRRYKAIMKSGAVKE